MRTHLALFAFFAAVGAQAAEIVWTNTAGGNWNVAANWFPNQVPGASDTAVITNQGIYTVTNNATTTVNDLLLGGGSDSIQSQTLLIGASRTLTVLHTGLIEFWGQLRIAGGTLAGEADIDVIGQLALESGTLGGSNKVVFNNPGPGAAGSMSWSGGTLAAQASVTVDTNGWLSLTGAGSKTLRGSVTNAGELHWKDGGTLSIYGVIHNTSDGVFKIDHDATLDLPVGSPGVVVNEGLLQKTGFYTGTNSLEAPIRNTGEIEVQAGALSFANKSVFESGTVFSGDGSSLFKSGTVTFSGDLQVHNLQLSGATLDGTNELSGEMHWISGNWAPTAVVTLNTNGTLNILNSGLIYLDGSLTNLGNVRWAGGEDIILRGCIHNLPGGLFRAQSGHTIRGYSNYTPVFVNEGGLIREPYGLGPVCTLNVPFIHDGTVYTGAGSEFRLNGGGELRDGCVFESELGATNRLAGGTFTLGGTVQAWLSHKFILDGATLDGTGALNGAMEWASGKLDSSCLLTVSADSQLLISGSGLRYLDGVLTNAGTVVRTDLATLIVRGSIDNLAGATFDCRNDEAMNGYPGYSPFFDNRGLFLKSAGTNTTTVSIPFLNNGTVRTLTGTISFTGGGAINTCAYEGPANALLDSGSYTLGGTISGSNLVMSGGTLSGSGTLSGQLRWTDGPLAADAALNVATTGRLELDGSALKILTGAVTNAGVIAWTGSGALIIRGPFYNQVSGIFDIQNDETINGYPGYSPFFVNDGLFTKSAGTNITTVEIPFTNNGVVRADSGAIRFAGGGACGPGCAFTGIGQTALASGTYALNGIVISENLVLSGATLTGDGTLNGSFDWTSGTISAGLSFDIPQGAVLNLRSSGLKTVNGSITNAGTILWTGTGNLIVRGSIYNGSTGVFEAQNDETINGYAGYSPFFVNEGLFRKSAGTNVTICLIAFTNNATIAVDAGTLRFASSFMEGPGGPGPHQALLLGGGTLDPPHPLTIYGQLAGVGTVTKSVTNQTGTVSPGLSNGALRILGHYRQTRNGTLTFDLGGTTAGADHSRLDIAGSAAFGGTLTIRLADGYLPNPGDRFEVLTYASAQGSFFGFNGFYLLGHDLRFEILTGTTNLTLVAVAAPDPERPPLYYYPDFGASEPIVFLCWPTEFKGFTLQSSLTLSPPNWADLGTNHWNPVLAWRPQEYFRLKKP